MFISKKRLNRIEARLDAIRFDPKILIPRHLNGDDHTVVRDRVSLQEAVQMLVDATGLSKEIKFDRPTYRLKVPNDFSDESPSK